MMKRLITLLVIAFLTVLITGLAGCQVERTQNEAILQGEKDTDATKEKEESVVIAPSEQTTDSEDKLDKQSDDISDKADGKLAELSDEVDDTTNSPDDSSVEEAIEKTQEEIEEETIQSYIDTMTLEEKVSQLFYLSHGEYIKLGRPEVGGVIWFSGDMSTAEALRGEIEQLQEEVKIPLFTGVDEEGGIVTRISGADGVGGTVMPTAWKLSSTGDLEDVYTVNSIIAKEIGALGFNMNFAPVADIRTNMNNPIIGKRAYSDDAEEVAGFVTTAVQAYREMEIIPVAKHFPGHGDTIGDSHLQSVSVTHDMERLKQVELLPFKAAAAMDCEVIMIGHIKVPEVTEEDLPASLSKELINDLLMGEMAYEGLIITDALNMKGISSYYTTEEVVDLGLEAGLDMFLMPVDYVASYTYLLDRAQSNEEIRKRVDLSLRKILTLKYRYGMLNMTEVGEDYADSADDKVDTLEGLDLIGSEAHRSAVDAIFLKE